MTSFETYAPDSSISLLGGVPTGARQAKAHHVSADARSHSGGETLPGPGKGWQNDALEICAQRGKWVAAIPINVRQAWAPH
jgi:hypothetical protein